MYQPKKDKYHSLTQVVKEMTEAGEKVVIFDGHKVTTKDAEYTLFDSMLITKSSK